MIKLLINRRLTLSYSLLIPIVYNDIRKGSISEELVLLLVQNCKLPCFALSAIFYRRASSLSPQILTPLFFKALRSLVDKLYLSKSTYIRALLIIFKEFSQIPKKPLTMKVFGAIIRVQQHMDGQRVASRSEVE